ncbi:choice-of-anchor D domain-containing protein [Bdellovibrio sp. SKB1291214]|uniref:choice-of-anchor D domain-containing protein n=1 Tax=Bdellovibrio sp. SKB1291214 TaxID=1732569 RepID=UPI000B51E118|nr:choice-of-anchor D domain-containing protein [Bdellovibrio sp. SKB1291214]UYL08596.1 choice-of-anchor D domain-containing protein [Bdellovibrio sp. SKB1291214]
MKTLIALLLVTTFSWSAQAAPTHSFIKSPIHTTEEVAVDYDFGDVTMGNGASQTWEFTAPENAAVYISQITITGDDFWADTDCLGKLDATYSCTFTLYFVPSKEGAVTGTVKIMTNLDNVTINAKAKGVAAPAQ